MWQIIVNFLYYNDLLKSGSKLQNPHELKIRHEASDTFLTVADSNSIHTPLLPGVLGGGGASDTHMSQFISKEIVGSEYAAGAGQKGHLKICQTREFKFMARKKKKKAMSLGTGSGSI